MDGIDVAASAMTAAEARLTIATSNLANVSTSGFSRLVAHGTLDARGAHVAGFQSADHGSLERTGRDFDLAIVGGGVFRLRDATGHISATRNGAFVREADMTLRDASGRALLGLFGPLRVPDGASIDERGCVMLAGRQLDRVPVDPGAQLRTGYLETPNVNAIDEMVDVMSAQRSFETAEKVVAAIDGDRQKAANDVARIK